MCMFEVIMSIVYALSMNLYLATELGSVDIKERKFSWTLMEMNFV